MSDQQKLNVTSKVRKSKRLLLMVTFTTHVTLNKVLKLYGLVTSNVSPGPGASLVPGNLFKAHNVGSHLRPAEYKSAASQEPQGMGVRSAKP